MTAAGNAPRVSLVHERFTEFAGSEAVVAQLAEIWPDAPILAPVGKHGVLPPDLEARLRTTALSRLLRGSTYAHLLPVLPIALSQLNVPECDVVVASHHAFANQVVNAVDVPVVSYVHSPARWVWDPDLRAGEVGGRLGQMGLGVFAAMYKPWDVRAARRVHTLVANSTAVATRIQKWWDRDAIVVHPPVDTQFYTPDPDVAREDFFLLAGRVVSYKRPDLAVRAVAAAGARLVVSGDGRALAEIKGQAGPGTVFLGRTTDHELRDLYRRCAALIMPGVEDFGIVPVEAQACGAPVIAVGAGGTLDTVQPGMTGELIPTFTDTREEMDAWVQAFRSFNPYQYVAGRIRDHAQQFSRERFAVNMRSTIDSVQ